MFTLQSISGLRIKEFYTLHSVWKVLKKVSLQKLRLFCFSLQLHKIKIIVDAK